MCKQVAGIANTSVGESRKQRDLWKQRVTVGTWQLVILVENSWCLVCFVCAGCTETTPLYSCCVLFKAGIRLVLRAPVLSLSVHWQIRRGKVLSFASNDANSVTRFFPAYHSGNFCVVTSRKLLVGELAGTHLFQLCSGTSTPWSRQWILILIVSVKFSIPAAC